MKPPQADDQPCQHSGTICCGFTCSAFRPPQTLRPKASISYSLSEPLKMKEASTNGQPFKSSIFHPIGFFPGTLMPYIDLSAGDDNDNNYDHEDTLMDEQSQVSESRVAEEVLRTEQSKSKDDADTSLQVLPTGSERDRFLPDTQRVSLEPPTPQKPGTTTQNSDALLPDAQGKSACASKHAGIITQNPDKLLPHTQINPTFTPQNHEKLLPDTQRITTTTSQLPIPNNQHVNGEQRLPVTQRDPGGMSTSQIHDQDTQRHNTKLLAGTQPDPKSFSGSQAAHLESSRFHEKQLPNTQEDPGGSSGSQNLGHDGRFLNEEQLPDTQGGPAGLSIFRIADLNVQHLDDLLPDTQVSYPSPSSSLDLEDSTKSDFESSSSVNTLKTPQKLSCRERKRIIVPMNRPANVTKAMNAWIARTHHLLDPFREDEDCWFHPSPPPARTAANGTLRPIGKIQKAFAWQDHRGGKHSIVLNFGIVSKLLFNKMSKQQKDGFISKRFHLSHLCGNWTCLNPAHTTVEPGSVNISRNICFSHRSGCGHSPNCMKDKKVFLDADGKQMDPRQIPLEVQGEASQASAGHVDWNDWGYELDDGEDARGMDDVEESDLVASIAGDETGLTPCS